MSRIEELRKKLGFSMIKVAKDLNIPYTTYVNYEKGTREPNSEMLILIADYYKVSIDYLLNRENYRDCENNTHKEQTSNATSASENPIFEKYNTLNALGKTKADEYITDLSENPKYTSETNTNNKADNQPFNYFKANMEGIRVAAEPPTIDRETLEDDEIRTT